MKAPRAGKSTMIRGSDGLDYADLAARLKGEPLKTPRGRRILELRQPPNDPRAAGAFIYAYDREYHALVQGHGPEVSRNSAMTVGNDAARRVNRLADLGFVGDIIALATEDPREYAEMVKFLTQFRVTTASDAKELTVMDKASA